MAEKIKYHPIEKRTPEGRRWIVVSCGEVATRAVRNMGMEPTPPVIKALVQKAKSNPATWEILHNKAHELRIKELEILLNQRVITNRAPIDVALTRLNRKYAEIDMDPARNYCYLDGIVLDGDVDESQKTTSQR